MKDKQEIKEMKKYFNECIIKDHIFEEDLTINFMKIALKHIKELGKGQHELMQSRRKWKNRYYRERQKRRGR